MIFVTGDQELKTQINNHLKGSRISSYPIEVLPTLADARAWLAEQPDPNLQSVVMSLRGMYPPEST